MVVINAIEFRKCIFVGFLFLLNLNEIRLHETRLHFMQSLPFQLFGADLFYFNILCFLCDLFVGWKLGCLDYVLYSALFPYDLSNIQNALVLGSQNMAILLDPVFAVLHVPFHILVWLLPVLFIFYSKELFLIYENGYRNNHIPSLNGLWFMHLNMFEQYSKLAYTLSLVMSYFLGRRDMRLLPVFLNGSCFRSFLPFIIRSPFLNIYIMLGVLFEYFMCQFNKSDIVNTNFMMWIALIFDCLYLLDIKFNKKGQLKDNNEANK